MALDRNRGYPVTQTFPDLKTPQPSRDHQHLPIPGAADPISEFIRTDVQCAGPVPVHRVKLRHATPVPPRYLPAVIIQN
jgi:hypothetical protein